jgi:hypothetical protein
MSKKFSLTTNSSVNKLYVDNAILQVTTNMIESTTAMKSFINTQISDFFNSKLYYEVNNFKLSNSVLDVNGNTTLSLSKNTGNYILNNNTKMNNSSPTPLALGTGLNGSCLCMVKDSTVNIYMGGNFTTANGIPANNIVKYNTLTGVWSSLGTGLNAECSCLAINADGIIYVGGQFSSAGGNTANKIAKYDPTTNLWSPIISNTQNGIQTSRVNSLGFDYEGSLYVGTNGNIKISNNIDTHGIIKYVPRNNEWYDIGGVAGIFSTVIHVNFSINKKTLYIAGVFNIAGKGTNVAANSTCLAKYDIIENKWIAMDKGMSWCNYLAVGIDDTVYISSDWGVIYSYNPITDKNTAIHGFNAWSNCLIVDDNGNLILGGNFTLPGKYIGKYDVKSKTAMAFNTGLNNSCHCLLIDNKRIYAGGSFTTVDNISANRVVCYDTQYINLSIDGLTNKIKMFSNDCIEIIKSENDDIYVTNILKL